MSARTDARVRELEQALAAETLRAYAAGKREDQEMQHGPSAQRSSANFEALLANLGSPSSFVTGKKQATVTVPATVPVLQNSVGQVEGLDFAQRRRQRQQDQSRRLAGLIPGAALDEPAQRQAAGTQRAAACSSSCFEVLLTDLGDQSSPGAGEQIPTVQSPDAAQDRKAETPSPRHAGRTCGITVSTVSLEELRRTVDEAITRASAAEMRADRAEETVIQLRKQVAQADERAVQGEHAHTCANVCKRMQGHIAHGNSRHRT